MKSIPFVALFIFVMFIERVSLSTGNNRLDFGEGIRKTGGSAFGFCRSILMNTQCFIKTWQCTYVNNFVKS